jgi:hypothetical protein
MDFRRWKLAAKIALISATLLMPNLSLILDPYTAATVENFMDINTLSTVGIYLLALIGEKVDLTVESALNKMKKPTLL